MFLTIEHDFVIGELCCQLIKMFGGMQILSKICKKFGLYYDRLSSYTEKNYVVDNKFCIGHKIMIYNVVVYFHIGQQSLFVGNDESDHRTVIRHHKY